MLRTRCVSRASAEDCKLSEDANTMLYTEVKLCVFNHRFFAPADACHSLNSNPNPHPGPNPDRDPDPDPDPRHTASHQVRLVHVVPREVCVGGAQIGGTVSKTRPARARQAPETVSPTARRSEYFRSTLDPNVFYSHRFWRPTCVDSLR